MEDKDLKQKMEERMRKEDYNRQILFFLLRLL